MTRIVTDYTNYNSLPISINLTNSTGTGMKLVPIAGDVLAPYWTEFGKLSKFNVFLNLEKMHACIVTSSGNKPVGSIYRSSAYSGSIVLLPDIEFQAGQFTKVDSKGLSWTAKANQFAARLIGELIGLDKALRSSSEVTPEPNWASSETFALAEERYLGAKLLDAEQEVEAAQKHKEELQRQLKEAGRLRGLLYEKGKALEFAIIEALRLLGFKAANYRDGDSEFDVIFESAEGRLLGEAEGKDSKSINIDKLRQLTLNIHEDLGREEVSVSAKGVLFGNGCRLTAPSSRQSQFTEKCVTAAHSSSIALVATSDLYEVAAFIADQKAANVPADQFAKRCRETILAGSGIVVFPRATVGQREGIADASG